MEQDILRRVAVRRGEKLLALWTKCDDVFVDTGVFESVKYISD